MSIQEGAWYALLPECSVRSSLEAVYRSRLELGITSRAEQQGWLIQAVSEHSRDALQVQLLQGVFLQLRKR